MIVVHSVPLFRFGFKSICKNVRVLRSILLFITVFYTKLSTRRFGVSIVPFRQPPAIEAAIAAVRKGFDDKRSIYDVMVHYQYGHAEGLCVRLYYTLPVQYRCYFAEFQMRAATSVYHYLNARLPGLPQLQVTAIGNPADTIYSFVLMEPECQ